MVDTESRGYSNSGRLSEERVLDAVLSTRPSPSLNRRPQRWEASVLPLQHRGPGTAAEDPQLLYSV